MLQMLGAELVLSLPMALRCEQDEAEHLFPSHWLPEAIEVDNGCKLRTFYKKQMATEVLGDFFGEEWKGYWPALF